jgi:hypothetical protein
LIGWNAWMKTCVGCAINAGLRALGVRAEAGQDEYENVGLTRHRFTEDWLTESPPRAW